jgi:tRNA-specific 2-thiouridylase
MNSNKKIIVGMSGGVDSSISAVLLKELGYQVTGLFMKNWEEDDIDNNCSSKRDYEDAKRISDKLSMNLLTVNFSDKYWDLVFKKFIDELNKGITPNPDIYCNKEIKFNYFYKYALSLGFDKVATGHYAKLINLDSKTTLNIPKDKQKDQTYFLYMLNQEIMKNLIFPLHEISKDDVKKIAKKFDINIYEKKESMGICFIGKRNFSQFIKKYIKLKPGDIKDKNNNVLGRHEGLFNYTIGQRKGIGVGGIKNHEDKPWFVLNKDIKNNSLIISQQEEELLYKGKIKLRDTNWINNIPNPNIVYKARFRHGGKLVPVKTLLNNNECILIMENEERAITLGQSAVLYSNNECIGGGIIKELC